MRTVRIAVAAGIGVDEEAPFQGAPLLYVNEDYTRSLDAAGAMPLVICPSKDVNRLREALGFCDALVLTGGADVDPFYYAEEPHRLCHELSPRRDEFEWQILKLADELQKPILGVCRGLQVMNVFYGGTLWQDLSLFDSTIAHQGLGNPERPLHSLEVAEGSFLARAFGSEKVRVNSFHHQAVKDVAPGFKVIAKAKDGVVEAIESTSGPLRVAVQWHPEMMSAGDHQAQQFFKTFVAELQAGL